MRVSIIGPKGLWVEITEYIPQNLTELVCSGEEGIGFLAECWADENNIPKLIIKSDKWFRYSPEKLAITLVDAAEMVVAIWDGTAKDIKLSIDYARKLGKPLEVYVVG